MSRVLEDYDASVCKELYSDDALPHITSSRSDAVSMGIINIIIVRCYIHTMFMPSDKVLYSYNYNIKITILIFV